MLQTLLVPLDGSVLSERTLPLARDLAEAAGASLRLAHVHVPHPPDQLLSNTQFLYEGLDLAEYDRRHRREEEAYLTNVASRVRDEDGTPPVTSVLLEGDIADEIAAYAREIDADMLLVATHAYTGMTRLWLGSVADTLIRKTHLPCLVIHGSDEGADVSEALAIDHVLVALDGSVLAEQVLPAVKDVASATGARITLLNVVSPAARMGTRMLPLDPVKVAPAIDRAKSYLEGIGETLRAEGFSVHATAIEHDVPARAIAEAARELGADLIALATHGYGGFRKAVLGSVADKVLKTSEVPLLVLKPDR